MEPDNADSYVALAAGHREKARRGNWITAMRHAGKWKGALEKAVELDPSNTEARKWLAAYLANAPGIGGGDKDRAVEVARGTVEHDEYQGRMSLGYILRLRGDLDESIAEFQKVIALAPDSADGYGGLGYTYLKAQRFPECEDAMRKYIEHADESPYAYEGLGDCFRNQDRHQEAISAYSKAVALDPYAWSARWELARMLQKTDDKTGAATHCERLVELTPNAPMAGDAKKRLRKLRKRR
jgi:tetratricopeptide (TPR) repeat protein